MPERFLNDQPFEHHCRNGTVFTCRRCDFSKPITAIYGQRMPEEALIQDVAEMAAWHALNIFPHLNGFAGYDTLKFHFVTEER